MVQQWPSEEYPDAEPGADSRPTVATDRRWPSQSPLLLIGFHFRSQLPFGFAPIPLVLALRTSVLLPDLSGSLRDLLVCDGRGGGSGGGPAALRLPRGLRPQLACRLGGPAALTPSPGCCLATFFPRHILLPSERSAWIHVSINTLTNRASFPFTEFQVEPNGSIRADRPALSNRDRAHIDTGKTPLSRRGEESRSEEGVRRSSCCPSGSTARSPTREDPSAGASARCPD